VSEERAEIYVHVADQRVKLVLPGDGWEYHEAKLAKEVSDGMNPIQIESGLLEMDPDSWMAVLQVSLRRAHMDVSQGDLAKVDLYALMQAVIDKAKEVLEARPTSPNGSGSPEASEKPEQLAVADPS
jgi:hypothetical protein